MRELDETKFDLDLPADKEFQVVGHGMNAVDWILEVPVYPEHNSKIAIDNMHRLGGGPAATATALCARYGLRTKYVGRVGHDEIGRFSLDDLRQEPMDLSHVDVVPGAANQMAVILVDRPTGERTVLWQRDPALNYRPHDLEQESIQCGSVLHIDGEELPMRAQAARWAREAGMTVTLDIDRPADGVEELLKSTDFVLPTQEFVRRFSGSNDWEVGLRTVAEHTDGIVIVTRGHEGAGILWEGEIVEVPSFPIKVLESTGAGDVYHGAFVYALFQDWSVWRCLRFANAAGALACTRFGARGGIPPIEEVLQLVDS